MGLGCSSPRGDRALGPLGGESKQSLGAACAQVTLTLPLPCHLNSAPIPLNSVPVTSPLLLLPVAVPVTLTVCPCHLNCVPPHQLCHPSP